MSQFSPSGGVNETEPTLIGDNQIQDCTGAEYRVGEAGLFVARGRSLNNTIVGVTGFGLYSAGFDTTQYLVAHAGTTYYASGVTIGSMAAFDSTTESALPIVGVHYANRHYLADGVQNRRLELSGGVTSFPIGMSRSTFTAGVSVTQGAGSISASSGVVYWTTEYDSARGIESMTGSSVSTGVFTSKDGVYVYVTGVSANPRADTLRIYRSTDGGGFPDGGFIGSVAIGTTFYLDTLVHNASLTVPQYGLVSIGDLDTERDNPPPVMSVIFGPYQDSLMGVDATDPRVLRFTPAGYPDSWPTQYGLPLETARQDKIVTGVVLTGRVGVFCNDSVHVIYRLPRDSDSIFAAGEMMDVLTDERGCVSRRGACVFTPPGGQAFAAWVSRDGIWASTLIPSQSPMPVTDKCDWNGRISSTHLSSCVLMNDPAHRRLIFIHRRAADTSHNTGVWFLDYQDFVNSGLRVTYADHGALADAVSYVGADGSMRVATIDSRSANGGIYTEGDIDADNSLFLDASGSVHFLARFKEFMPAGARGTASLGKATYMHDAGPNTITHRLYVNRRDSNPETKVVDWGTRNASDVVLGRAPNSFSTEIESTGTQSYGVHWIDYEAENPGSLGGRGGA